MSRHHHIHHKHNCQDPKDFWQGMAVLVVLALFAVIILLTIQFWQISVPIIIGLVTLRLLFGGKKPLISRTPHRVVQPVAPVAKVVCGSHLVTPSAEDRIKALERMRGNEPADPEVAELEQQVADAKRRNGEIKEMRRQQAARDIHLAELRAQLDALDGEYKQL